MATSLPQSLESEHEVQPSSPSIFEETKIESKPTIENTEKMEEEQKETEETHRNEICILQKFAEINTENVTSILDSAAFR